MARVLLGPGALPGGKERRPASVWFVCALFYSSMRSDGAIARIARTRHTGPPAAFFFFVFFLRYSHASFRSYGHPGKRHGGSRRRAGTIQPNACGVFHPGVPLHIPGRRLLLSIRHWGDERPEHFSLYRLQPPPPPFPSNALGSSHGAVVSCGSEGTKNVSGL